MKQNVLIIGGGLAGMSAALLCADRGMKVSLAEKNPALGGYFPLLEKQFPTDSCGVCFLSPDRAAYCPTIECGLRDNITILENTETIKVDGDEGNFTVTLKEKSNCIRNDICVDCGKCVEVCPVSVPYEFGDGVEMRKAVYKYYPKMVLRGYYLDGENCTRCNKCAEVCPVDAVDFNSAPRTFTVEAEKIILSTGFLRNKTKINPAYGLGAFVNVLNSVQFERILNDSGPAGGMLTRPADGAQAQSIAFIQCVGSRAVKKNGYPYCSSVCCMIALKQAALAKQKNPDLQIKIFYMDLRTFGKGFEEYANRVLHLEGVELIRYYSSSLLELGTGKKIRILYSSDEKSKMESFDLVILSLGFHQEAGTKDFLQKLNVRSNEYGFAEVDEFIPNMTSRKGIYAAGAAVSPKDIPDTVVDGASAAAMVMDRLSVPDTPRIPRGAAETYSQPRVGLFLCTCGGTISEEVLSSCRNIPELVWTGSADFLCRGERPSEQIKKIIADNSLHKMVIAGCSVRELQMLFRTFFKETGYSELDFEFVNVRDALFLGREESARQLLTSAVTKVKKSRVPEYITEKLQQHVLIIGGGIAGLTASLRCAYQGFTVTLTEQDKALGGRLRDAFYTIKGSDFRVKLNEIIEQVMNSDAIEVLLSAEIEGSSGRPGDRITRVKVPGSDTLSIRHGAVILATGGREASPSSYGYAGSEMIVTQQECERMIGEGNFDPGKYRRIGMVLCVESREEGKREYCSRVCCNHAIKNILKIKELNEYADITVLYRDIRSYGFYEDYYKQARQLGVLFVPYTPDNKPRVETGKTGLELHFFDPVLNARIEQELDLIVLAPGIEPRNNAALSEIFDIGTDGYGFFEELNKKAGLVKTGSSDIFFCGLCHAPKHVDETIIHANAASAHAGVYLSKKQAHIRESRAFVIDRFCSSCEICVEVCPYKARSMNEMTRIAEVADQLCEGCGNCISACPNGASQMYGYEKEQVLASVDNLIDV